MYNHSDFRNGKAEHRDTIYMPFCAGMVSNPLHTLAAGILVILCAFLTSAICPGLFLIVCPVMIGILGRLFYVLHQRAQEADRKYHPLPYAGKRDIRD